MKEVRFAPVGMIVDVAPKASGWPFWGRTAVGTGLVTDPAALMQRSWR